MKLQIALDVITIEDAVAIVNKAVRAGNFLIEAGTPLIKAEGMRAIRELRKIFPDMTIVADMKTMDAGYIEAELAIEAGADIISVLGAAADSTIEEALKATKANGKKLMVDLIGVKDKISRVERLEDIGVDYILVHTGIDEQKVGKDPFDDLKQIASATKVSLAVAGGINDKSIERLKEYSVEIVIVGGFITKSSDPEKSTRQILSKMV
jgi:3-hexulose-6-phosphate synthase/6-phospho-3-hexuloisomerase